jgi:hypothetical protein
MEAARDIRRRDTAPAYLVVRLGVVLTIAVALAISVCPAGAFTAFNATFQSSVAGFGRGNWVWTDGTREYALICKRTVLQVVDVTNRAAPAVLADVISAGYDMKEVRTYDRYAYAINQTGPMQIIYLGHPDSIRTVATFQNANIEGAHTIEIDGHYAYLSLWGVGPRDLRILDLSNPVAPVEVGFWRHPAMPPLEPNAASAPPALGFQSCGEHAEAEARGFAVPSFDEIPTIEGGTRYPDRTGPCGAGCACNGDLPAEVGYQPPVCGCGCGQKNADALAGAPLQAHDCYVKGNRLYVAMINGGFAVVDISDKTNPETLALVSYPDALSHSMWGSDDGKYLFTTDELLGGHLRIWNVSRPSQIYQVGSFRTGDDRMIHNVYVRGALAYLSYYTDGLRVLDISDVRDPVEIAFYDTYAGPLGGYFAGAWGAVSSATDGAVFVSDMTRGLLVINVDPELRAGHYQGVVTDAVTGERLMGATVRSLPSGHTTETDVIGAFYLRLGAGQHTFVAEHYGHRPDTLAVNIAGGKNAWTQTNFALDPLPWGRLRVYVTDSSGLVPVPEAAISAPTLTSERIVTGADGIADAGVVPARDYAARIGHFGHTTTAKTLLVPADTSESAPLLHVMLPVSYLDDAKYDQGWSFADPADDATMGRWLRDDSNPSWWAYGITAPDDDAQGNQYGLTLQTGYGYPGLSQDWQDLDGGQTTLTSPLFRLDTFADPTFSYYRWFTNDTGPAPGEDDFRMEISNDGGQTWVLVEETRTSARAWTKINVHVSDYVAPTDQMKVRFIAEDRGGESVVEALIDLVSVTENPVVSVGEIAGSFSLAAPWPNPAAGGNAAVRFRLARDAARCRIDLVDVRGRVSRVIADGSRGAGEHLVRMGAGLAPGLYFVRLAADGEESSRRFVVVAP